MTIDEQQVPSRRQGEAADRGTVDTPGSRVPRELRRLFAMAPGAAAAAPLAYAAMQYFPALQLERIDNEGKVLALTLVNSLGALAAMVAQPLAGVLSDRTRTRYGSRRPWMLTGALIGAVGLIVAGLSTTVASLVVAAIVVQTGFNAYQATFNAILPDRVPRPIRGRYSTLVGLGQLLAGIAGQAVASIFATAIPAGYFTFAGLLVLVVVAFVVFNPDGDNRATPRPPFSLFAILKAFWVNPIRHPDFFWAFLGRFLIFSGYAMVASFGLYIAQSYIGMSLEQAAHLVPLIGVVGLPGFLVATAIAGPLSDRIGRRKPIVFAGGVVIAASAAIPLIWPTPAGLIGNGVIATIGVGMFVSVDQALVSEVLPSGSDFAKDLGVINIAVTLPYTVGPILAGVLVTAFGGYGVIYVAVLITAGIGAFAVLPIKGVK
ncbi:MFS transporter [Prescottella agglutinans]|uniref:MFS family permease n=1 Tax=Prescottella agglutinans TaxID=1644129 RepID=A0ABT6M9G7_9NOCA|nr:MFS transporter [Prescottella agglutinans]MDH6280947.1 MFS family permease [Prescottella agglutinans]